MRHFLRETLSWHQATKNGLNFRGKIQWCLVGSCHLQIRIRHRKCTDILLFFSRKNYLILLRKCRWPGSLFLRCMTVMRWNLRAHQQFLDNKMLLMVHLRPVLIGNSSAVCVLIYVFFNEVSLSCSHCKTKSNTSWCVITQEEMSFHGSESRSWMCDTFRTFQRCNEDEEDVFYLAFHLRRMFCKQSFNYPFASLKSSPPLEIKILQPEKMTAAKSAKESWDKVRKSWQKVTFSLSLSPFSRPESFQLAKKQSHDFTQRHKK